MALGSWSQKNRRIFSFANNDRLKRFSSAFYKVNIQKSSPVVFGKTAPRLRT